MLGFKHIVFVLLLVVHAGVQVKLFLSGLSCKLNCPFLDVSFNCVQRFCLCLLLVAVLCFYTTLDCALCFVLRSLCVASKMSDVCSRLWGGHATLSARSA